MDKPQLTPWFKRGKRPAYKGVYTSRLDDGRECYRYWGGRYWGMSGDTPEQAVHMYRECGHAWRAKDIEWRGLSSAPKGAKL